MSEQPRVGDRKPQPGDTVRWTMVREGVVEEVLPKALRMRSVEDDKTHMLLSNDKHVSVEVLEPADDPSRHEVGTVMRGTEGTSRDNIVVRVERGEGVEYQWLSVTCGLWYAHDDLLGFEVTGYVPDTPAAEANPVPPQVLKRVREMLSTGQKISAIKALHEACVGMGLNEAKNCAKSLPEWAEGERFLVGLELSEPVERVDPHDPVVLKKADTSPHGWEPKVWHSDGPEPAEHVKVLRYLDGKPDDRWPFVVRRESGWLWATSPDDPVAGEVGAPWAVATGGCPGRYREVQP